MNDQWRICFTWSAGRALRFWLGLQADYDLEEARRSLGDRLEKEVQNYAA